MKNKVIGTVMLCGVAGAIYGISYLTSYYGTIMTIRVISKYFL